MIFSVDSYVKKNSSTEQIKSAVMETIHWQMKADRKIGALKSFQGYMWKEGYESGVLRGV